MLIVRYFFMLFMMVFVISKANTDERKIGFAFVFESRSKVSTVGRRPVIEATLKRYWVIIPQYI